MARANQHYTPGCVWHNPVARSDPARTGMLLVALGCGRLPGILDIAAKHSFVVFGTMEEKAFAGLSPSVGDAPEPAWPVYFYEIG